MAPRRVAGPMAPDVDPDARLEELGIDLPAPMRPKGTYRAAVRAGSLLHVAGQGPVEDGEVRVTGRLGEDLTVEEGYEAARLTGLNVLAVARDHLGGSLSEVRQVVQCTVFVASTPEFTDHPAVADGVTQLFVEVLGGDAGRPARAAVGVPSLPMGIPVEAQVVFEVGRVR